MNKRAQTLIFSLWILAILTFLAVGIGHRVSMALRLSRYQRDKLKASCLAQAGMNIAIAELRKDNTNNYDSLDESWAENEGLFKKVVITENQDEFATVGYTIMEDGEQKIIFGVVDEERKLNINTASKELLLAFLEEYKIDSPGDIVENIRIWRGDIPDDKRIYEPLGYPAKAAKFTNCQELKLVKGINPRDYQKLEGIITVYTDASVDGESLININTASPEVLTIFVRAIAKKLAIPEAFADSLANKINEFRLSQGPLEEKDELAIVLTGSEEVNIFNHLINNLVFKSDFFLIAAYGNVGKIKSGLEVVYNRTEDKLVYWHGN